MTHCDLALRGAQQVQFLPCSYEDSLTYSNPGPMLRNKLLGWVDSDYVSDPCTRKSVTGYVLSLNNAPVSWKAKHQDCVTLSSAKAEYIALALPRKTYGRSGGGATTSGTWSNFGRSDDAGQVCWDAQRGRCPHKEPAGTSVVHPPSIPHWHEDGVQGVLSYLGHHGTDSSSLGGSVMHCEGGHPDRGRGAHA
eukprot:133271-Rhodomonas_salina.1